MAVATLPEPKVASGEVLLLLDPLIATEPGFVFYLRPSVEFDDDQFFEFCQINRDFMIERTDEGEIIIMAPAGGEASSRNAEVTAQLQIWAKKDGTGVTFDSSGGFKLGKLEMRAPDAAWVRRERFDVLKPKDKRQFPPLCPDFVIELKSSTDRLKNLQAKMEKWIEYGAQLAWLIDPDAKRVHVYHPNGAIEIIENADTLSGEPLLKGFVLDLTQIW